MARQHMKAIVPWEEDQALDREEALDHERTRRYQELVFPSSLWVLLFMVV